MFNRIKNIFKKSAVRIANIIDGLLTTNIDHFHNQTVTANNNNNLSNNDDLLKQLERLATLKTNGMLTDEEFESAKKKLLS